MTQREGGRGGGQIGLEREETDANMRSWVGARSALKHGGGGRERAAKAEVSPG